MSMISAVIASLLIATNSHSVQARQDEWSSACFGSEPIAISDQDLSRLRDRAEEGALQADCEAARAAARSVRGDIDAWLSGVDVALAAPEIAQTFRRRSLDVSGKEAALLIAAARDNALRWSLSPPQDAALSETATLIYRALVAGQIVRTDTRNQAMLSRFLDENGWPRDEDLDLAAWLIAQHADGDRPLQAHALELLEPLARDDRASAMRFSLLHDRWAVGVGQAQRFGLQGNCRDGEWVLTGDGDPDVARRQRALFGLENYDQWAAERCARQ